MPVRPWTFAILTMALLVTGCGGEQPGPYAPGDAARGTDVFMTTCATCHGADAKGIPDKGADLTKPSDEITKQTEEQFYNWLRMKHDPMLPKLPKMTDQKLRDVEAYVLSIRQK